MYYETVSTASASWVHICACVFMCVCVYALVYACVYVCVYVYVHAHVCISLVSHNFSQEIISVQKYPVEQRHILRTSLIASYLVFMT